MPVYSGIEGREFFVWVDPNNKAVENNLGLAGSFIGGPIEGLGGGTPEYLQFVANPNFKPSPISPFHNNVITHYKVEYNLEWTRYRHPEFEAYPSRLWALFLLDSKQDAIVYQDAHPSHVRGRVLKRCITVGPYTYSKHDAAWIYFLREGHYIKEPMLTDAMLNYWKGERVDQYQFVSCGKHWLTQSAMEILFYGRVDFPNKNLSESD